MADTVQRASCPVPSDPRSVAGRGTPERRSAPAPFKVGDPVEIRLAVSAGISWFPAVVTGDAGYRGGFDAGFRFDVALEDGSDRVFTGIHELSMRERPQC